MFTHWIEAMAFTYLSEMPSTLISVLSERNIAGTIHNSLISECLAKAPIIIDLQTMT